MNTELSERFGINPAYVAVQVLCLVLLCLLFYFNVRTTRRILKTEKGAGAPIWVLVIWLLPLIGAICATCWRRQKTINAPSVGT